MPCTDLTARRPPKDQSALVSSSISSSLSSIALGVKLLTVRARSLSIASLKLF
ncbi:hypothetical protein OAI87_01590 [Paracoccaceae bacterium]|nr:hypothetical protein [Paracoccaceae bacterium]